MKFFSLIGTRTVMAALVVVSVGGAGLAFAQADVIKTRKEGMAANRNALGAIKKVVDAKGPASDAVAAGRVLETDGKAIPSWFPKGSDQGDTKALPAIWADPEGFAQASKALELAGTQIAMAGEKGDMAGVTEGFAAAGKACAGCHERFRAK